MPRGPEVRKAFEGQRAGRGLAPGCPLVQREVMWRILAGTGRWLLAFLLTVGFCVGEATGETWRILRVDNMEIVSNTSERHLKRLHREIFYFNRSMEALFGKKFVNQSEPLLALVLRSEGDLEDFIGERARHVGGLFLPQPGFEMFIARSGRGSSGEVHEILFHELTHRHMNPFDLPVWLDEGIAELFETVEVERRVVRIGRASSAWIRYLTGQPRFHTVDFDQFFGMTRDAEHYRDGRKSTDFYAKAWLFAHYCWFGEAALKPALLKLANAPVVNEAVLREHFGYGYDELRSKLSRYARSGRYGMYELELKGVDPLPEPNIEVADPDLWRNFHARAHFLLGNFSEARDLASGIPRDSPLRLMAVETLAGINRADGQVGESQRYLEEANQLGTRNTLLRTLIVGQRLSGIMRNVSTATPLLSQETAAELMADLLPSLRLHRKNPLAVRIAISIFDLAEAEVPGQMMEIFEAWEAEHRESAPPVMEALERIRGREADHSGLGSTPAGG